MKWLALLLGGGLGTVLRFALALWVDSRVGIHFPWGTLAVNATGCLAIGVLATLADAHAVSPALRLFLGQRVAQHLHVGVRRQRGSEGLGGRTTP